MKVAILTVADLLLFFVCTCPALCQPVNTQTKLIAVGDGWAKNSVNTAPFRRNALASFNKYQVISYYNPKGRVVVGKREHGSSDWELEETPFQGNAADAHNTISIMIDGAGFIHLAWNHHNSPLNYARSRTPLGLTFDRLEMTGKDEQRITYPEFYRLKNGDLLFLYRNGESGNGKVAVNSYNLKSRSWSRRHENLIDGENQRNAYWQCYVDIHGTIHLSWVWRESADVASNHDLCYARSTDNGSTWTTSSGKLYDVPINATTSEYAWRIPQGSQLINQTSMSADAHGNPFIATYWNDKSGVPQYQVIYRHKGSWLQTTLAFRSSRFSLSGVGTKRIAIARPQLAVSGTGDNVTLFIVFRDEERNSVVSAAVIKPFQDKSARVVDLSSSPVDSWEPSLDSEYWKTNQELHLFVQRVRQADAEGLNDDQDATPVYVLEWVPRGK